MIKCNKCSAEFILKDTVCPEYGAGIELKRDDIESLINEVESAKAEKRFQDALDLTRALAKLGVTEAEKEYATLLEKGQIAPRNLDRAMEFFYRAARKNDAYSAYRYSRLVSRENDEAARFWLIFSAILGCEEAYPRVAEEFSACGYDADANYFYSLAAFLGDVESIVEIATRYYEGKGVVPSPEYAKWFMDKLRIPPIYAIKLAYKLRHITAKEPPSPALRDYDALLGRMLWESKRLGYDTVYFKICEILAERGDPNSEAYVGLAAIEGKVCKQDFAYGMSLLTKASAKGSIAAHLSIADIYSSGVYTEKNTSIVISSYRKAGELGSAEAYEKLGEIFYTGDGVEEDIAEAVRYFTLGGNLGSATSRKRADDILGERESIFKEALSIEESDPTRAFSLYATATSMGHSRATLMLAKCMEGGRGVKVNRRGAFLLYKKAAERGEDEALLDLGRCYADGIGTKLDYDLARQTLKKAEGCGVAGAHDIIISVMKRKMKKTTDRLYSTAMRLIFMKRSGEAIKFLETARDLMNPKAIYTLGCMYEFGAGVKCDKNLAYDYYEKAYALQFRDPRSNYKLSVLRLLKNSK